MILALLEHSTHDKAAAALGISTVTLWRATKKPEFAEAYRKARRDAFSQSVARLQHASNAAVGTLLRVMTDREAPAASRVRAADVVLQTALRGMEIEDIDARLSQLEQPEPNWWAMTQLQRRLKNLEAVFTDPVGLVPHTQKS